MQKKKILTGSKYPHILLEQGLTHACSVTWRLRRHRHTSDQKHTAPHYRKGGYRQEQARIHGGTSNHDNQYNRLLLQSIDPLLLQCRFTVFIWYFNPELITPMSKWDNLVMGQFF